MINRHTWYEQFLLAHPEEQGERQGRWDDKDSKQWWRYDEFLNVLVEVDLIPEEEAKKFFITRIID